MAALVHDAMREGAVGFTSSQLDMHVDPRRRAGAVEPRRARRADRARRGARRLSAAARSSSSPAPTSKAIRRRRPRADARDVRGERQADEHQPGATAADAARRVARRHRVRRGGAARRRARVPAVGDAAAPGVLRARRHVPVRRDARVPRRVDPAARRARAAAAPTRPCATRCARQWADTDRPSHRVRLGQRQGRARRSRTPSGSGSGFPSCARYLGAGDELDAFLDASLAEDLHARLHARRLGRVGARAAGSRDRRDRRAPAHPPRQQRRRRAPLLVLRRRLHDAAAHRVRARRAPARGRGRAAQPRSPRRSTACATAASCARVRSPTSWSGTRPRLAAGATRWVEDFPAGGGRFVVDAEGYVALVVNGEVVRRDGVDTGARPGSGRAARCVNACVRGAGSPRQP